MIGPKGSAIVLGNRNPDPKCLQFDQSDPNEAKLTSPVW